MEIPPNNKPPIQKQLPKVLRMLESIIHFSFADCIALTNRGIEATIQAPPTEERQIPAILYPLLFDWLKFSKSGLRFSPYALFVKKKEVKHKINSLINSLFVLDLV